jgi:alkanesulfonate monooxygenase SsuD/methylene tetrahydromethanopterin reductase-like flavin-dependent oxidoreductase (luciferase family)
MGVRRPDLFPRRLAPIAPASPPARTIPTFIGDDVKAMRDAARQNLGLYTTFPFFQRLFRASGFEPEAAQMEKGVGGGALSDRLLDAVCLLGPLAHCRQQLAAFRAAGTDLPILVPPIGVEGARAVIKAFRR